MNVNLACIDSLVAYEIQRNLPAAIAVGSVMVQFLADPVAVEGYVIYIGDAEDIVDCIFLVNLPRTLVLRAIAKVAFRFRHRSS